MEELKYNYPPYSVLMSVYYKEKPEYLKQSIESMLNQTVLPAEIVIIEDGPLTEELYGVLDEFSAKLGDDAFRRIANEKNIGLGRSLNRGIELCNNELIARMDTDDISRPDRCRKQLIAFSENPEADVIGAQISEFVTTPEDSIGQRIVPQTHKEICEFMKMRCPFNHMTVMYKKSAVLQAGNYLDFHLNEDLYLWIRMFLSGATFANLPDIAADVRVGKDMYCRRGGITYYKNQKALFKYMRKNKMISWFGYQKAKTVRFVVQVLMPNRMRQKMYKRYVRK